MSGILCAHYGRGAPELLLNLSNTVNPNIQSRLNSAGWDGNSRVKLVVDPSTLLNTLVIPTISFPNDLYILIGQGALTGGVKGTAFSAGGDAIYTRVPIFIENYGSIKGGGGGGGPGGEASVTRFGVTKTSDGAYGGEGQGFVDLFSLVVADKSIGGYGSTVTNTTPPGPGEWIIGDTGSATARGGNGGNGGGWRQPGSSGADGTVGGSYSSASTSPGRSGYAAGLNINGIQYVTWIVRGDA